MSKKLLVLVEGVNDEQVLKVVFQRGRELKFEPLDAQAVDFRRHSSEVCTSGAVIARSERHRYDHFLLIWDQAGSAYEARDKSPQKAQGAVQSELNSYSLKSCSKAVVIAPELEIWLWSDLNAVARVLEIQVEELTQQLQALQQHRNLNWQTEPKEVLREIARQCSNRADSELYRSITEQSNLKLWLQQHSSFRSLVRALRSWFPLRGQ
jgi:hypothetical protein